MADGSGVRMARASVIAVFVLASAGCQAVSEAGGAAQSVSAQPRRSLVTNQLGRARTVPASDPSASSRHGSTPGSPQHAFDSRVVIGRRGVVVAAWHARTVGGSAAGAVPIAGTDGSLYAVQDDTLLRLDPRTARVLARRTVPGAGIGPGWVMAGALWLMADQPGDRSPMLRAFNPITLEPSAAIPASGAVALTGNVRTARLYLATATRLRVIDATTTRTIASYRLRNQAAAITALATPPDDSRLYVSYSNDHAYTNTVQAVAPLTGTPQGPTGQIEGQTGFEAASPAGLWLQTGSGMSDWLEFRPAANLNRSPARASRVTAGGGWSIAVTATSRVVWLSGTEVLACADPDTARMRALTFVRDPSWNIAFLTVAGSRLFGFYRSQKAALVELSPPPRCEK